MADVNTGAAPNDGSGDPLRAAFNKLNATDRDHEARLASLAANKADKDALNTLTQTVGDDRTSTRNMLSEFIPHISAVSGNGEDYELTVPAVLANISFGNSDMVAFTANTTNTIAAVTMTIAGVTRGLRKIDNTPFAVGEIIGGMPLLVRLNPTIARAANYQSLASLQGASAQSVVDVNTLLAALTTEVRDGRIYTTAGGEPSNISVPEWADLLLQANNGGGTFTLWRPSGAPSDNKETPDFQRDQGGRWWRRLFSQEARAETTALRADLDVINANLSGRIDANVTEGRDGRVYTTAGGEPSGQTIPAWADVLLQANNALSTYTVWRPQGAPSNGQETPILQKDANDRWWRKLTDKEAQEALQTRAPIESPALTGKPTAPTPTANTDDTQIATTAFVQSFIRSLSTDLSNGRVFYIPAALSPSGATIPEGVDFVKTAHFGTGLVREWRSAGAPADSVETDILKRDAKGQWWNYVVEAAISDEVAARIAAITALTTSTNTGLATEKTQRLDSDNKLGLISLSNATGTNTITASMDNNLISYGVVATAAGVTVKLIPAANNTGPATLQVTGDIARTIVRENGSALVAGDLVGGRGIILHRLAAQWAILAGGVSTTDMETARQNRIIADSQMGSATLANIGGTANAVTAEVPGSLKTAGISAVNLRAFEFLPLATNTGPVTINIDGNGALELRDQSDTALTAGAIKANVMVDAVKFGTRWRIASPDHSRAEMQAAVDASAVILQGKLTTADTARINGDAALAKLLNDEMVARLEGDAPTRGARGDDALPAVTVNDVVVVGIDALTGRALIRLTTESMRDIFAMIPAADAAAMVTRSGYAPPDSPMFSGRENPIPLRDVVSINGVPTIVVFADGKTRLAPDDWTIAYIAQRLNLDDVEVETAPSVPAIAGVDAWDQWKKGDLDIFTARIYGDQARQYMRLRPTNGVPWLMAPERARVRLVYGDGLANATTDRSAERFERIATLKDGQGDTGWNGVLPNAAATDLARVGSSYAALTGDRWLATKTGQQPLVGIRSEAVEGATLAALAGGQAMANLKRAVTSFASVMGLYGRTTQVDVVSILFGGVDANTGTNLLALVNAIITQTSALQVNVFGPAGTWQDGNDATILGATNLIYNKGDKPVTYVSPLYWCDVRAGSLGTPTPDCMTMLAELEAHAAVVGSTWLPPLAFSASRSGDTINVDFDVMADTILAAPSIEGLSYSGATILSATVVANPQSNRQTRLAIKLSAAAAGTLTYAVGKTGTDSTKYANRGQLRDNWSATSATGKVLRRYAIPFKFEVN